MQMKKTIIGSAIALTLAASSALAGVSATDAARLGKDLTPMGAEAKGNGADIPAWTGGINPPAGFVQGMKHIDPFASDKVKFTITAQNYEQYKDNLTDGQIALFKKYPLLTKCLCIKLTVVPSTLIWFTTRLRKMPRPLA